MSARALGLLLFCGTLLLHVVNVIVVDRPDLIGDEARYQWYATSLTHGTYATPEKPDIINGPGYTPDRAERSERPVHGAGGAF
ncbi:MAG: hypothetical protein RIS79_2118 [Verrucomicrobiota bacterium]|jgi:hypothetical protein